MNPIYSCASLDALPHPEEVQEMILMGMGVDDEGAGGGGGVAEHGSASNPLFSASPAVLGMMPSSDFGPGAGGGYSAVQTPVSGGSPQFPSAVGGFPRRSFGSLGDLFHHQQLLATVASNNNNSNNIADGSNVLNIDNNAHSVNINNASFTNVTLGPHQYQHHQRTGTVAGVTMNTLCNVMGAGVLALPLAVHNGSVVMSLVLLLLSAYVSLKAVHILGVGCDAVHRYSFTECVVLNLFPALIHERRECIIKGVDPMLNSTKRLLATLLLEFVIVIESFGTLVVYARVIGDSMPPVLKGLGLEAATATKSTTAAHGAHAASLADPQHSFTVIFLSWILPAIIFFILSCSRSMEELKWTSLIGFGTILYIVIVVVIKYFEFVYDNSPVFHPSLSLASSPPSSALVSGGGGKKGANNASKHQQGGGSVAAGGGGGGGGGATFPPPSVLVDEVEGSGDDGLLNFVSIVGVFFSTLVSMLKDRVVDLLQYIISLTASFRGGDAATANEHLASTSSPSSQPPLVLAADGVRWFGLDWGCFATMSTYSLAFGYHFNVPYFYSELRDRTPTNLLKTVYYALPIVVTSYALTGILGYLSIGPSVAGKGGGNIVDRMDPTSFLVNVGRIGLLFHFATVYPVISVCARRGLHRFLALMKLCAMSSFGSSSSSSMRANSPRERRRNREEGGILNFICFRIPAALASIFFLPSSSSEDLAPLANGVGGSRGGSRRRSNRHRRHHHTHSSGDDDNDDHHQNEGRGDFHHVGELSSVVSQDNNPNSNNNNNSSLPNRGDIPTKSLLTDGAAVVAVPATTVGAGMTPMMPSSNPLNLMSATTPTGSTQPSSSAGDVSAKKDVGAKGDNAHHHQQQSEHHHQREEDEEEKDEPHPLDYPVGSPDDEPFTSPLDTLPAVFRRGSSGSVSGGGGGCGSGRTSPSTPTPPRTSTSRPTSVSAASAPPLPLIPQDDSADQSQNNHTTPPATDVGAGAVATTTSTTMAVPNNCYTTPDMIDAKQKKRKRKQNSNNSCADVDAVLSPIGRFEIAAAPPSAFPPSSAAKSTTKGRQGEEGGDGGGGGEEHKDNQTDHHVSFQLRMDEEEEEVKGGASGATSPPPPPVTRTPSSSYAATATAAVTPSHAFLPPKRGMPARNTNFSVNSFSNLFVNHQHHRNNPQQPPPPPPPPVPGDPATTTNTAIILEAAFIVVVGTIVAWYVPGVGVVIEFLGAFFGIPTQMILPGIIGVKLFHPSSRYQNRWWMAHVVAESSSSSEEKQKGIEAHGETASLLPPPSSSPLPSSLGTASSAVGGAGSGGYGGTLPTAAAGAATTAQQQQQQREAEAEAEERRKMKAMLRECYVSYALIVIGTVCTVFGVARTLTVG